MEGIIVKNMSIKSKLVVAFLCVIALATIVGIVGIVGILRMNAASRRLFDVETKLIVRASNMIDGVQKIRIQIRALPMRTGQSETVKGYETEINTIDAKLIKEMAEYEKLISSAEERGILMSAENVYKNVFMPAVASVISGAYAGAQQEELFAIIDAAAKTTTEMIEGFNQCLSIRLSSAEAAAELNQRTGTVLLLCIIATLVLATITAFMLATGISTTLCRPIVLLRDFFLRFVSKGDLSLTDGDRKNIENKSNDEIGQCIDAAAKLFLRLCEINDNLSKIAAGDLTLNIKALSDSDTLGLGFIAMVEKLNEMLGEIRNASDQVSAGAGQIAQGAQELANGSGNQASAIEEFSGSLSRLLQKTQLNAVNAENAKDKNLKEGALLQQSIQSMDQMLDAMMQIDESAQSITKVIKVIDDIAFQTNILALNAAVEAARAGQHGKGFAVVADEVRNLASKSAEAAKETALLIEGSVQKVAEGNQIVERTNEGLQTLSAEAKMVMELLVEVANASADQAQAIEKMNLGIGQISDVVQANSAAAQESSAAAEELSSQATALNNVLTRFQIHSMDKKADLFLPAAHASKAAQTDYGKY